MASATLPPGPRLPAAAQAALWGLRYPEFTARARARYGDTWTLRAGGLEPAVVTTDRDAVAALLTGDPLTRRHANDVVRPLIGDGAVILLDGPEHLARRRLLLPPFHGERVRGYAALMERLMTAEVARWRPGDEIALLPVAQNLTIEVILQAVLGVAEPRLRARLRRLIDDVLFYPAGAARLRASAAVGARVRGPRRLREAAAFAGGLMTPAVMTYFPQTKARAWWNPGTWRWWHHYDRLAAVVDEQIATTKADPILDDREDILALLVRARDDEGRGLTDRELREDVLTLISAGHETTAAAIAWGAVLLAHHPAVQETAAAGDDAHLAALAKEILRFRPPLPVAATRRLDESLAVGRHTVPAGTMLVIDAWGIHHDPGRHADPERFAPERFLDGGGESYSWLPFGGGHRRCIGAALADLEIRVTLATILRAVRLEPVEPDLPPPTRRGIVMVPMGGARVRIASR